MMKLRNTLYLLLIFAFAASPTFLLQAEEAPAAPVPEAGASASAAPETSAAGDQEGSDRPAPKAKELRTVIKMLTYADARDLMPTLAMFDVQARVQKDQNALLLRGEQEQIDAVLQVLEALDKPARSARSFEIHGYVVGASYEGPEMIGIPARMKSALGQLQDVLGYTSFRMLDTVFLLSREGSSGRTDGNFAVDEYKNAQFSFQFERGTIIPGEKASSVRFDGLSLITDNGASLSTNVEVRENQTVVVGKAKVEGGDGLILIIHVDVLD